MFIVEPVSWDFVWRTQESWDSFVVVWNCIGEGWRTPPGCPCDLGEICGHFGRSWERGAWPAQNLSIVLRLMEPPRVMRLYCTCKYLCYLMDILGAREKSLGHGQLKIVSAFVYWILILVLIDVCCRLTGWNTYFVMFCLITFWFVNAHTFLIYCSLLCTFTLVLSVYWFVVVWSCFWLTL